MSHVPGMGLRRIGVTGAEGYLGRYVMRELEAAGYDLVAVDRCAPSVRSRGAATFRTGEPLVQG